MATDDVVDIQRSSGAGGNGACDLEILEISASPRARPVRPKRGSLVSLRDPSAATSGDHGTAASHEPLRTGDVVYFRSLSDDEGQGDGLLHSEGLVTGRVGLQPLPQPDTAWGACSPFPPNFDDCLYRICPVLEYEQTAMVSGPALKKAASMTADEVDAARRGARSEAKKNEAALARLNETETLDLRFGKNVQLQHIASGRFLTAKRGMAEKQRENMMLKVEPGSRYAVFKIQARYKFRKEGDIVYDTDQILLESLEIPKHTVGGSTAPYHDDEDPETSLCEANLSEKASGWSLHKYTRVVQGDSDFLRAGRSQSFLFWHEQAAAFLTSSSDKAKRVPYLRRTLTGEATSPDPAHKPSAKSAWYFEHIHAASGAVLTWESTVRIRHSATGLYLAVVPVVLDGTDDAPLFDATLVDVPCAETTFQLHSIVGATNDRRILLDDCAVRIEHKFEAKPTSPAVLAGTVSSPRSSRPTPRLGNLDSVVALDGGDGDHEGCVPPLAIGSRSGTPPTDAELEQNSQPRTATGRPVTSCWLHFDAALKPRMAGAGARPGSEQVPGQTPPSWRLLFSEKMYSEDPFEIYPIEGADVRDMLTSLAFTPVARRYTEAVARRGGTDPPEDVERSALAMLLTCVKFHTITGDEGESDEDGGGGGVGSGQSIDAIDGPPRLNRQNFSRELKLLDVLFPMVQAPVNAGISLKSLADRPAMARVQRAAFKALMQVVQDNRRSEIYFATHTTQMPPEAMVRAASRAHSRATRSGDEAAPDGSVRTNWVNATIFQVGDVPQAAECLNMILSNNTALLDKYVDTATIDKFIDLIGNQGPHKRFMKFFCAICSCNGKQIISNQELCLTRLFLDAEERKRLMLVTRDNGALRLPLPRGTKQASETRVVSWEL